MENMQDHDLLIRLDVKISEILRRMDSQDTRTAALEAKVNQLENFRWWLVGAAAGVGALGSIVANYLQNHLIK